MSEETTEMAEGTPPIVQESPADRNWRAAREEKQRLEQEVADLKAQLSRSSEEEEEPSSLVERKHLKEMEVRIAQQMAALEAKAVPDRLKARFPDLTTVVNDDTLARLEREEPEMFLAVKNTPDLMARGVAAYKAIKALGYGGKDTISENTRRLEENQSKPGNINSVGGAGPLEAAEAIGRTLSKERKAARYAEVQRYKSR